MIDINSQFFAILTAVGEAKQANANALGVPWKLTTMAVGDANGADPIPNRLQTKLINERRRAPLNQLKIDPVNPSVLVAEQVIPADVGGFWVREIGLYDSDGDLVAIANCAPSFKPVLTQGSGRTQIVRMNFIVSSINNVELKIDPAIVLATRDYVDQSIISVLPANKTAGTYFQVTVDKRGVVQSGRNPFTLEGFGIIDALAIGQYGLGGTVAPEIGIDTVGLPGGFYSYGAGNTSFGNKVGLVNIPYGAKTYAGQIGFVQGNIEPVILVRGCKAANAWGQTRELFHTGNFDPSKKADKATGLSGYGIEIATQTEAEAQADQDNAKPMTALRVFQAITKRVVQATESVMGIARVATQAQTNSGVDDSTMITPKKFSAGITALVTQATESIMGIAKVATQAQTNSGVDDSTMVTPKKFSAGIAALVIQATESVRGIARIATQAQTNAGADDLTFVTPKKLRLGFTVSFNGNGYIIFPSWLAGLTIQWTNASAIPPGGVGAAYWPIAFPNGCVWALAAPLGAAGNTQPGNVVAGEVSAVAVNLYNWGSINSPARAIGIGV